MRISAPYGPELSPRGHGLTESDLRARRPFSGLPEILRALPYRKYLLTKHWRALRRHLIGRRGVCCELCGASDVRLEVHHKTYEHLGEEWEHLGDLIVLCSNCHKNEHTQRQKAVDMSKWTPVQMIGFLKRSLTKKG